MGNTIPPVLFVPVEHQNGMMIWQQKKLIGQIGLKYLLLGKDQQVPRSFLTPPLFFFYRFATGKICVGFVPVELWEEIKKPNLA